MLNVTFKEEFTKNLTFCHRFLNLMIFQPHLTFFLHIFFFHFNALLDIIVEI